MAINLNDTRTLLGVVERSFKPTTTLVDIFFPNVQTFVTETVDMEYRKGSRKLAPFVVPGSKGVNMSRSASQMRTYKAPLMKPKRVITAEDLKHRAFGENIYSQRTPEERAAELRANDLAEMIDMCARTQEYMASQLLINGEYEIKGYADDGTTEQIDTLTFDFNNKTTISGHGATWDEPTAKIYNDIGDASAKIRRAASAVPTVAICSSNVVNYLINNEQLLKYMMVPNRDNLALMSLQPKLIRPELMRVGFIQSLNLEIYAYDAMYEDAEGALQQYIPNDHMIIGIPGRGKRLFGAVTQMESDNAFHTYASEYVPKVSVDIENDVSTLAVSSRCVLCPEWLDDWAVIKVK